MWLSRLQSDVVDLWFPLLSVPPLTVSLLYIDATTVPAALHLHQLGGSSTGWAVPPVSELWPGLRDWDWVGYTPRSVWSVCSSRLVCLCVFRPLKRELQNRCAFEYAWTCDSMQDSDMCVSPVWSAGETWQEVLVLFSSSTAVWSMIHSVLAAGCSDWRMCFMCASALCATWKPALTARGELRAGFDPVHPSYQRWGDD